MEYTCDECYNLKQKSIVKCPLCGKNTFDKDKLDLCLKYMGSETKKAFEAIG